MKEGQVKLKPTTFGKTIKKEESKEKLSSIIERLNDRFGTNFTDTDKLSIDQIKEDIINNDDLAQKAKSNTIENFKFSYDKAFLDIVINRMGQNKEFFMKILENGDFRDSIMQHLMEEVYTTFRSKG